MWEHREALYLVSLWREIIAAIGTSSHHLISPKRVQEAVLSFSWLAIRRYQWDTWRRNALFWGLCWCEGDINPRPSIPEWMRSAHSFSQQHSEKETVAANVAPLEPLLGTATCLAQRIREGFFEGRSKPKTFPRVIKWNLTLPAAREV